MAIMVPGGADISIRVEFIVAASRMTAARETDEVAPFSKPPPALAVHWIQALSGLTDVGRWSGPIGLTGCVSSGKCFLVSQPV